MASVKINFRCPEHLARAIDEEAAADHRDRTSLLTKIIASYYENKNGKKPTTPRKKAGAR